MRWIIENLVNVILELVNDLMGWAIRLVEGFELNIGYGVYDSRSITSFDTREMWSYINPLTQSSRFTGPFDKIMGAGVVPYTRIFWMMGFALCILLFVYTVFFMMFDAKGDSGSPASVAARFILSFGGVAYSYSIFVMFERVANLFFLEFRRLMVNVYGDIESEYDFYHLFTQEAFPESEGGTLHKLAISVISLFIGITIFVEFIKLVFEFYQRYILLGALFYTAPLAFATIVTKGSGIFKSWLEMLVCQFIIMAMSLFFLTTFASAMINISQGEMYTGENQIYYKDVYNEPNNAPIIFDTDIENVDTIAGVNMDGTIQSIMVSKDAPGPKYAKYLFDNEYKYALYMLIMAAWLVIGQKVDEILRDMGLSAARTGQALGGRIMSSVMMAGAIVRTGGKLAERAAVKSAIAGTHAYEAKKAVERKTNGYEISTDKLNSYKGPNGALTSQGHENLGNDLKSGAIIPESKEGTEALNDYLKNKGIDLNDVTGGRASEIKGISAEGEHIKVSGTGGEEWDIIPNNGEYTASEGAHLMDVGNGEYSTVMGRGEYFHQLGKVRDGLKNSELVPEGAAVKYIDKYGKITGSQEHAVGVGIYTGKPNSDGSLSAFNGKRNDNQLLNNTVYTPVGASTGNASIDARRGRFSENGARFEAHNKDRILPKNGNANLTGVAQGKFNKGTVEKNTSVMARNAKDLAKSKERTSVNSKFVNQNRNPNQVRSAAVTPNKTDRYSDNTVKKKKNTKDFNAKE